MSNKNFILVIAILLFVAAVILNLSFAGHRGGKDEPQMSEFPKTIGEWEGKDIPLEDRDYQILETKNLIVRDYKNAQGQSVMLYIIYSQENRRALHPPEICYTGGGATIVDKSVIPVTDSIQANKFTIEAKDYRQIVVYWFRAGTMNTFNYMKQQINMVMGRVFGKRTSGAMVRLSTNITGQDEKATIELIREFSGAIQPLLNQYVP